MTCPTNVLTPRAEATGDGPTPLYLIDRQPFDWSPRLWLGAADLVHAAVPYWSIDARRALAPPLLDGYHATLLEEGVTTLSREALDENWRACLCQSALTAIERGTDADTLHDMRWLWEAQLRRALAALAD